MKTALKIMICILSVFGTSDVFSQELEIVCHDIDETGWVSAYEEHEFTLLNHTESIVTDVRWVYSLRLPNGEDAVVAQVEDALSFKIDAIENETLYSINEAAEISGKVTFTGKVDGRELKDVFDLSLDLKPKIKAVNILKKEGSQPFNDTYKLYYTVEYVGSDHLFIQVETEYSSGVSSRFVYQPHFAHVVSDNLVNFFYNWVDITAENKYGKDVYTIELPPFTTGETGELEIVCHDIDETGWASAYDGHEFTLLNHTEGTVTDARWVYSLRLPNGEDAVVAQAEDVLSFKIDVIENETLYSINEAAEISGKVTFTGKVDGRELKDVFDLSLDLKPKIKAVNILKKESNQPHGDSYNLHYTVEYAGNDHLLVRVEEEHGAGKVEKFVYEPSPAHVVSENITASRRAWVDIIVENEYGKDIYTIELPPFKGNGIGDVLLNTPERYTHIDVFDDKGVRLQRIQTPEELRMQKRGLYILKFYKDEKCMKAVKVLK